MDRQLCLMHANCQGDELETLLLASPAFTRAYRLVRRTNYTKEPVCPEELAACGVFLYQHLDAKWGTLSSASLLGRLGPSARALRIPNLFFKGYWPFWTSKSPISFGDSLLNRLIDEGAPKPAILKIYLRGDITHFIDLKALLEETIAIERKKEAGLEVRTVDFFLSGWREKMLYHTVNHPGRELLIHVAQGLLVALDLSPLTRQELDAVQRKGPFPSYADFDLPIHPQVASFYGLNFAGPEHTFAVFGKRMTFEQYISRYIDCRLNGLDADFLAYLQLV